MKKIFKIIGFCLLSAIGIIGCLYFANHEALPQGKQGKEADELAYKMLNAIQYQKFKNTSFLEWSFRNNHFYKWNKKQKIVEVSWENNKVILHTNQPEKSIVFIDGKKNKNEEMIQIATRFFNNDSFWLVAPFKIFDPGTKRSIVKHKGKDALLITYTSGGSTPGDSYLWILNKDYIPVSYKMWTKIIPIGGVSATWSDWKTTEVGIKLPTSHQLSLFGMQLNMGDVKAYN